MHLDNKARVPPKVNVIFVGAVASESVRTELAFPRVLYASPRGLYAFSLIHSPTLGLILLGGPSRNMDSQGICVYHSLIWRCTRHSSRGCCRSLDNVMVWDRGSYVKNEAPISCIGESLRGVCMAVVLARA